MGRETAMRRLKEKEEQVQRFGRMDGHSLQYVWSIRPLTKRQVKSDISRDMFMEGGRIWLKEEIDKAVDRTMAALERMMESGGLKKKDGRGKKTGQGKKGVDGGM